MVKVEITNEEIQALDILLDKVELKPIVGFKVVGLRYKIQQEVNKEQQKAVKARAEEIVKSKKKDK